jgi:hypothetical protein
VFGERTHARRRRSCCVNYSADAQAARLRAIFGIIHGSGSVTDYSVIRAISAVNLPPSRSTSYFEMGAFSWISD